MPEKDKYTPQQIEPKWQARWAADNLYRSVIDPAQPKHYALTMLPYPSGDLHIGHWYAMSPSDARARYMRMKGFNVLFPMGFDAFGLPAENAAIQRRVHPKTWTYHNIERMRQQMRSMGTIFDWEREAVSADPEFYRWTQWFFLKFFENDLAYRQEASVDFCPRCNTTLAREQVWGEDRHCERCGTPVIKKDLEQWFFRITNYADELLDDMARIRWPEKVKLMQTNWIGRSEGAHVTFRTEAGDALTVFTTRPDTLWGATFMVLAPEHPLVEKVTTPAQRAEVEHYVAEAERRTEIERAAADKEKTGVFTGGYAINPVNGERIPIWIADYVLMSYGFGAIMAVPAHDERDFAFARKFGLPIRAVIQPDGVAEPLDGETMAEAYAGEGHMFNSAPFDGTPTANGEAVKRVTAWLEERHTGRKAVNYRLRDWLISRQRYWGAPIPIVYCERDGIVPVPYDQLPVLLPEDVEFMPTGESPLKFHAGFLNTTCPTCGGPARRETDTMDTFMCSSWYHLRYLSPEYDQGPFDPREAAYWLPVDQYTGGIEHATMHLIYTRFFTKALRDCGVFDEAKQIRAAEGFGAPAFDPIDTEPMMALFNQGMILGEPRNGDTIMALGNWDGEKLSATHVSVLGELDRNIVAEAGKVMDAIAGALGGIANQIFGADTLGERGNAVTGEIVKRTENLLNVVQGDGREVVVEVNDGTQIVGRDGQSVTIDGLRYRLGIEKMSKSKGNVVAPDELVAQYGADVVRAYLMFAFRWEAGGPWDSQGIQGVVRWLNDVWNLLTDEHTAIMGQPDPAAERALRRKVHQTIQRMTEGLETFGYNTSVAALMELKNALSAMRRTPVVNSPAWDEAIRTMLLLMAPFTPHIAEELWERNGGAYSIHSQPWPEYDPEVAKEDEITLVVSVNGKVRARIQAPAGMAESDATARALANEDIQRFVAGKDVKKVIYVADRGMMNIVV
ncbi:MAG: leucine--tRNA ligase [Anaerolineae bacterium]|nr:leucine--tRNA ligase [Anaerolineae bacterium]